MYWNKTENTKPPVGEEVLAYHPAWVDEDFNEDGIRIGFLTDENEFYCAEWMDYKDCYMCRHETPLPTHWMPKPKKP